MSSTQSLSPVAQASGTEAKSKLPRQIRVAYVVHTFAPGGLERCVARLVNHLDRNQFQPLILCLHKSGLAEAWLERDDIEIVETNKRGGNDPMAIWRLAKQLRQKKIDVVHSHNWGTLVETAIARRLAGVPHHVHAERGTLLGSLTQKGVRSRMRATVGRLAFRSVDSVITNANSIRSSLSSLMHYPSNRVQVIPNGIAQEDLRPAQTRAELLATYNIPEQLFVVGSVGRLAAVKNFKLLIQAAARLVRNGNHKLCLVLVGDGPELASLQQLVENEQLQDHVRFVGWCDKPASWLAAFDVYVNTSVSEGMSQAILEAMAVGLPIIATDVGDSGVLVGRENARGILVPSGDVARLADAIGMLFSNPSLMREYRQRSLEESSSNYSLSRMVRTYEQLYRSLVDGHAA